MIVWKSFNCCLFPSSEVIEDLFFFYVQEHTILFIINLLSPPVPPDYSGSESHLINYAPLLNVLLLGISSVDCVQIISLHGLVSCVNYKFL